MIEPQMNHIKKGFLAEIKSSQVESFDFQDNYDFHGSAATKSGRGGKRAAAITDIRGYKRSRAHTTKSFDEDNEHKLDENDAKFKTLLWKGKNMEEQPEVDEFLKQGWLYKTSQGKITANLIRDQDNREDFNLQSIPWNTVNYFKGYIIIIYSYHATAAILAIAMHKQSMPTDNYVAS